MQSEVWSRVLEVWDEAKCVPEDELEDYLDQVFAGDEEARREAATLLSRHAVDDSFLESPAVARVDDELHPVLSKEWGGQRLGAYHLEEKIGVGGMAAVYRARRADGEVDYQVAVKLIHLALIGTDVEARFRTERQILAGLDQPNIARLLDAGATESGIPFVVMELISGAPITEYCQKQQASLEDRLELFRKVCDAVQYAHQHLVVHRDLKPGNILVNEAGEPKLLDFGIAKLLEPSRSGDAPTATLNRALTPNYASPEQLLGGRISTASDIYSLGVVLHELLTGQRPYTWAEKTPLQVVQILERDSLSPPSSLAVTGTPSLKWGTDLDNIVLKALAKEPESRYASAQELSEDLRRYLAGLPVTARASTPWYRLSKLVRRNRWAVALATLLALSTLTFAAFSTFQARRLAQQRDMAEAQRRSAEEVTEFLEEVFKVADPGAGGGETIPARELVDLQVERVQQELSDHPELQARLLHSLGWIYGNLGLYQEVQPLFERSLKLREQTFGVDHLDTAESQRDLAMILTVLNEHDRAEAYLEQALATERRFQPPDDLRIALTLDRLGTHLKAIAKYDRAEEAFRESLSLRRQQLGDDESVSSSLHNLADVLRLAGDLDEAESTAREALRISQEISESSLQTAERLYLVGHLDYLRGRYGQAENHFRESLALHRMHLDEQHPGTVAMLGNLASVQLEKGDHRAAIETYRETLEVYRNRFGERSAKAATILDQLGISFTGAGDLELAQDHLREALEIRQELFGLSHPILIKSLRHLAITARDRGELEEAESLALQALKLADEVLNDEHPDRIPLVTTYGQALAAQDKHTQAEETLRRALEMALGTSGADNLLTIYTERALASSLVALGEAEEGRRRYLKVIDRLRRKFDPAHPNLAYILLELADLMTQQGEVGEAERLVTEAREILNQAPSQPAYSRWVLASLEGVLLAANGSPEEAEELLVSSYEHLVTALGSRSPKTREALVRLVRAYESWKKPEEAARYRNNLEI